MPKEDEIQATGDRVEMIIQKKEKKKNEKEAFHYQANLSRNLCHKNLDSLATLCRLRRLSFFSISICSFF